MLCTLISLRRSPEKIALTLDRLYLKGHKLRVPHETIYNYICAQPVGDFLSEMVAKLSHTRNKRKSCSKGQDRRGQILDMNSIHVRLPEVEDPQFPGHSERVLIKGLCNASDVVTSAERTSRLLMLVKLPHPRCASAATVVQAFTDKLCAIALLLGKTHINNQRKEMVLQKLVTIKNGMAVYSCDPHSPWQGGSNENTNGLVRQYLSKGTDLSDCSQEQIDGMADEINNGPRKGLGVQPPFAVYRQLRLNFFQQSTPIH